MAVTDPSIVKLLQAISLEEKEEANRYRLDQEHTLKTLKAEGLALHPLSVTRRGFGYADYPEFSFRLHFPPGTNFFRDGAAIECFAPGEEPVKAVLLNLDGQTGECRLFAPDFPDWLEDGNTGIKLAPDMRTTSIMKKTLQSLEENASLYKLFRQLHSDQRPGLTEIEKTTALTFFNRRLNESQQAAVNAITSASDQLMIVHGPPGTGKTTTLTEAIRQLVQRGEKVLVSAPSNTAIDNIAKSLINANVKVLRVGNAGKADPTVYAHTPEGRLSGSKQQKEIKDLRIQAEAFRKMALKYKKHFGKAEREQRNLLFQEVKNIRNNIKKLLAYNEEKLFEEASVIAGTPIGLYDADLRQMNFSTLIMDEAGQCIEPLAWCIFPLAPKIVLAGDHLQLPPTILSQEASQMGLDRSILETAIDKTRNVFLLDTQYRMRSSIAGFSSLYFYEGKLLTPESLGNQHKRHICFIDTAGTGFGETSGTEGSSLQNEGELSIAGKLLEGIDPASTQTAFISPYSAQVTAAAGVLPKGIRCSTIDSFQGQETDTLVISLVRSNDEGNIGFLKDYRRMNVAITRAREKVFVIGDSATIGSDPFYRRFLKYVEQHGEYKTAWEFDLFS
jgi:predicted DNA helicase